MSEDQQSPKQESKPVGLAPSTGSGLAKFWTELKRRHVVRVGMVYAIVGWLVIQVANATFEEFGIPLWAYRFVVLMVVLGFPISVVVAWAFELTPEGIKTTKTAEESTDGTEIPKAHAKKRGWFSLIFAAAAPTLIFGTLAIYFYATRSDSPATSPDTRPPTPELIESDKSIAVLPLTNMSPDPENAFFADGVHEDILTNLARIRELLVIGRTSTLQYRDTVKTLQQIGEELNVRYLVEGSVRRANNQVKVTVQLIDTQTGGHLWAQDYSRPLDDIFAIQAAVAKDIAVELKAVISPVEVAKLRYQPTENPQAYDYFLQARQSISDGGGGRLYRLGLLEQSVSLDPNFAEAWAILAWQRMAAWRWETNRADPVLREKAHRALDEAIRLNPALPHIPHAQSTFVLVEDNDFETSIDYLLKALSIDPKFAFSLRALGSRYLVLGRLSEAQHHLEESLRTDPRYGSTIRDLNSIYRVRKLWDKAYSLAETHMDAGSPQQERIATTRYLETGDIEAFVSDRRKISFGEEYRNLYWADGYTHWIAREFKEAWQSHQSRDPDEWYTIATFNPIGTWELKAALIHYLIGDEQRSLSESTKAIAKTQQVIDNNPIAIPLNWSNLAIAYALQKNRSTMESAIATAREKANEITRRFQYQMTVELQVAMSYAIIGDYTKAVETLEHASQLKSLDIFNRELALEPIFDRLRGNPRFEALLED